jgi:hypothetical protein
VGGKAGGSEVFKNPNYLLKIICLNGFPNKHIVIIERMPNYM